MNLASSDFDLTLSGVGPKTEAIGTSMQFRIDAQWMKSVRGLTIPEARILGEPYPFLGGWRNRAAGKLLTPEQKQLFEFRNGFAKRAVKQVAKQERIAKRKAAKKSAAKEPRFTTGIFTHVWNDAHLAPWDDSLGEFRDFSEDEKASSSICRPAT
jgi:hypothetical protein